MHVWMPDYFIPIARRSLPKSSRLLLRPFSDHAKFNKNFPGRISMHQLHTNLATHMVDHAFSLLCNKAVEDKHKDYLYINVDDVDISKFDLPQKYVVVCPGFTAITREWLPKSLNETVSYIREKGYPVIFLGNENTSDGLKGAIKANFNDKIDYSKGINLLNKTTIEESTKIIYNSKCVVGLDCGLGHLGNTHPTLPIVMGYSNVEPKYRMGYRNGIMGKYYYPIVASQNNPCQFCQSTNVFTFNHDFKWPLYPESPCNYDLTSDLYIEQLKKIL